MLYTTKTGLLILFVSVATLINTASAETTNNLTRNDKLPSAELKPIVIIAKKESPEDVVYDDNLSSNYKDKQEIERFGYTSPADIFDGMVGVNNGDSRNSGAIDPNIRGIQGQGRVPVAIDGTEQAITVYRGYNGANNRNYIDPLLIGSVKVEKGPSISRDVNSSVGGAVVMKTLNVDDVLKEGENFGFNIRGELGNNAISEKAPVLSDYIGKDVDDFGDMFRPTPNSILVDKGLKQLIGISPREKEDYFGLHNRAGRIAAAYRNDKLEVLGAYAMRDRGNYFSGKKDADDYQFPEAELGNYIPDENYYARLSETYKAGEEVPNTSIDSKSSLFKLAVMPTPEHRVELGIRSTDSKYGDILPSRISNSRVSLVDAHGLLPQYPLSHTKQKAYNLDYKFTPENKWVDFHGNIWKTDSDTLTYNGIGDLLTAGRGYKDFRTDKLLPIVVDYMQRNAPQCIDVANDQLLDSVVKGCSAIVRQAREDLQLFDLIQEGKSTVRYYNDRKGITLSNKMQVRDDLAVTIGANMQKETIHPDADLDEVVAEGRHVYNKQRYANRDEWNTNIRFDYQPTDWLDVSIGGKYNHYEAEDEKRNAEIASGNQQSIKRQLVGVKLSAEGCDANDPNQNCEVSRILVNDFGFLPSDTCENVTYAGFWDMACAESATFTWQRRTDGKFHNEDNPYLNGDWEKFGWHRPIENNHNPAGSSQINSSKIYEEMTIGDGHEQTTLKDSGFVPSINIAVKPTDNIRLYVNYNQAYRMPSIFEATTGFSNAEGSGSFNYDLKPEKAKNFEVGYVHNLQSLIPSANIADIKVAYYDSRIEDVIDRHWGITDFNDIGVRNWDEKRVSGIEVQGRYGSGKYFADLGVSYTLKDKLCDKEFTKISNPYYKTDECVDRGFEFGYLANMAQPKMMTSLGLGGRFFDKKLEVGTRARYHSARRLDSSSNKYQNTNSWNPPLSWKSASIFDAYASYKMRNDLKFELSGTNLTDKFYLDPLSRSVMPAPGRTIVAKAEYKF